MSSFSSQTCFWYQWLSSPLSFLETSTFVIYTNHHKRHECDHLSLIRVHLIHPLHTARRKIRGKTTTGTGCCCHSIAPGMNKLDKIGDKDKKNKFTKRRKVFTSMKSIGNIRFQYQRPDSFCSEKDPTRLSKLFRAKIQRHRPR